MDKKVSIFNTKPVLPDRQELDRYIDKIYEKAILTNFGPIHDDLNKNLAEYLGVENLLLVSSGTTAIQVALRTYLYESYLRGEHYSTFVTTPFSFPATSAAIKWLGLDLTFLNVDKYGTVEVSGRLPPPKTPLLATNVYGNPSPFEQINDYFGENNVIYDSSHCFGIKSSPNIFNYGYAHTLSFHATKAFSTAEGGAVIFKNKESLDIGKRLINFGIDPTSEIIPLGTNAKLSELHAAFGLASFPKIEDSLIRRRKIGERYTMNFRNSIFECILVDRPGHRSNFAYYPIIFPDEKKLLQVMKRLKLNNIYPRRYFYPCLSTIGYNDAAYLKKSVSLASRVLCLPIYPDLDIGVADFISELVLKS